MTSKFVEIGPLIQKVYSFRGGAQARKALSDYKSSYFSIAQRLLEITGILRSPSEAWASL